MTAELWSDITGVALPKCNMQGCCCRGASPSVPYFKLLEKAANGETFARDFFTIFLPYDSHESARAVEAGLVERTLRAAEKDSGFRGPDDVVFYKCRYIGQDNKCQIWEDRPELCRAYPDTPFVVFAPNCAFEPWATQVRAGYSALKDNLKLLNEKKQALEALKHAQQASGAGAWGNSDTPFEGGSDYTKIDALLDSDHNDLEGLNVVMPLLPLFLVSPLSSTLDTL
ncbi:MAG: YkgJ family cysteine cluster protein [Cyanobacteria bacterium HKST-UBA06]|nr:YkgJ family cysteine cluster protein [Cyanobacteria bacterium HKST-UBA05]MCA9798470.1 YkgJ family cysteine cluster protein [Cyanobacteria bacterium HKST-UBA04]MCA9808209.1 YkgJ family cysteine cluster protein [Cyanobacteria bacterium HKST-UBA06]MCA9840889.1 YkgJ family cysteine cluster protein [Cyanobacteria bacterium HKST-UBA03]